MTAGQFIGGAGSERDQMIGRLLERTEALMNQHDDFKSMLSRLDQTLEGFGRTVSKLEVAIEHVTGRMPSSDDIDVRFARLEAEVATWTAARKRIVLGAILISLVALTWGTLAGTMLRAALGLQH